MPIENLQPSRIDARGAEQKYETMRAAILDVLPTDERGMTWANVVEAVAPRMPEALFPHHGSVRWYSKAVQSDLVARGLIERLPRTRPLRLRRMA